MPITHTFTSAIADSATAAAAGEVLPSHWNANHTVTGGTGDGIRLIVTSDTTYYVATTGNDTTGTGTVGNPWRTIQHAINYVMYNITAEGVTITIQVADGTYAEQIFLGPHQVFSPSGTYGVPLLNLNTTATPGNVVIAPTTSTTAEFAAILCINSRWQIGGAFTVTNGASGCFSPFAAVNDGHLCFGTDAAAIDIIITDYFDGFTDCENSSSVQFGAAAASTIAIQSTLGTWMLCDVDSHIVTNQNLDVNFAVDPGFTGSSFASGMFEVGRGGGASVFLENTWSGATPAAAGTSVVQGQSRLFDKNTYQPAAKYNVDQSSWYNYICGSSSQTLVTEHTNYAKSFTGIGLRDFSGGYDVWEIDIFAHGAQSGTGNLAFYNSTANTEPLLITSDAKLLTYSAGVFAWNNHASAAESAAPDTGLSRTAAATVAMGNGTQGDYSGTLLVSAVENDAGNLNLKADSAGPAETRVLISTLGPESFPTVSHYYPAGSIFRNGEVGVLGTNDVFFQGSPGSGNGYTYMEDYGGLGMALGTGQITPVLFRPNRTDVARADGQGLVANTGFGFTATPGTIASLPAAPTAGMIAAVNDALGPAVGAAVAAGGAAFAAVCYNGAAWKVFAV